MFTRENPCRELVVKVEECGPWSVVYGMLWLADCGLCLNGELELQVARTAGQLTAAQLETLKPEVSFHSRDKLAGFRSSMRSTIGM